MLYTYMCHFWLWYIIYINARQRRAHMPDTGTSRRLIQRMGKLAQFNYFIL